jgi:hypothetical protein
MKAGGLVALVLCLSASVARADRVPSLRVPSQPAQTGIRPNIFVPYTTTGNSTFMSNGYSGPRIFDSPQVNDASNPGVRPVYNLPFYGGVQSFGNLSNGSLPRDFPLFVPHH